MIPFMMVQSKKAFFCLNIGEESFLKKRFCDFFFLPIMTFLFYLPCIKSIYHESAFILQMWEDKNRKNNFNRERCFEHPKIDNSK